MADICLLIYRKSYIRIFCYSWLVTGRLVFLMFELNPVSIGANLVQCGSSRSIRLASERGHSVTHQNHPSLP